MTYIGRSPDLVVLFIMHVGANIEWLERRDMLR
jgi:hypothetical protein